MPAALPERVDVARQVQGRRVYSGSLPFTVMSRLRDALATAQGEARYHAQFDKDALGIAYLQLQVEAGLPLLCQRTLEVFALPVVIDTRLGLIANEEDEAGLPGGYEPLLIADGTIDLAAVIEDELILAVPVVPTRPGAPLDWVDPTDATDKEPVRQNPFAALAGLKNKAGAG